MVNDQSVNGCCGKSESVRCSVSERHLTSTRDLCRAMFRPSLPSILRIRPAATRSSCALRSRLSKRNHDFHWSSARRDEQAPEQNAYQAKRSTSLTPLMMLLGITPVITFALGTWQIQRLQWKVDLIDDLQEKLQRAPMELPNFVEYVSLFYRVLLDTYFPLPIQHQCSSRLYLPKSTSEG